MTLLVFDLLALDGEDLTGLPLAERRERLESLGLAGVHWQVPDAYDDGLMLMAATEQQGLEGIVSKKRSSRYHPGRRSADWLKFPHRATGSYVVGGWRRETDSSTRIGAVLVGEPGPDGLRYRGRVGSGIAGKAGQRLLEVLRPLEAETLAVRRRGAQGRRPGHHLAGAGGRRRGGFPRVHPGRSAAAAGLPRRTGRPDPRGPDDGRSLRCPTR